YTHYVFDAYGTLFDVHAAASRHADDIGEGWDRLSQTWRAKHLEYTWIYAQTGRHTTFWDLTERSLDTAIATIGGVPSGIREKLLEAYRVLDAYPEVPGVLDALRAKGATCAILTNGDPDMIADATSSAGIADKLDRILTVHDVGIFKPSMRVYSLVTDTFGCKPGAVSFQSSNRWDAAGATVFGFDTLWVNRSGAPAEYSETPPTRVATDLKPLRDD
ncbi:MAG: haloacid dehalogenase type II, partial [Pseudomonadota bacterium]